MLNGSKVMDKTSESYPEDMEQFRETVELSYMDTIRVARELSVNNGLCKRADNVMINSIFSHSGFTLDFVDEKINNKVKNIFKKKIDITEQFKLWQLLEIIERRRMIDGAVFICLKLNSNNNIKLELIYADYLDTDKIGDNIYNGIEKDKNLKPIKYHFRKIDKKGIITEWTIKAKYIISYFNTDDIYSTIGMSDYNATIQQVRNIDKFQTNLLKNGEIRSMYATVIKTNDAKSHQVSLLEKNLHNESGNKKIKYQKINNHRITYLNPQESLEWTAPNITSEDTNDFMELSVKFIGMSRNIPYELFMADYSKVNFSSSRMSVQAFFRMVRKQQVLLSNLTDEILNRIIFFDSLKKDSEFNFKNLDEVEELEREYYYPPIYWIDPKKELDAIQLEIKNGFRSWQSVIKERYGKDPEAIMKQHKEDIALFGKYGILHILEIEKKIKEEEDKKEKKENE